MKRVTIVLFLLVCVSPLFAQSWLWGKAAQIPLKSNDFGAPVATDKAGNVYMTGDFVNSITFFPYTLFTYWADSYLVKYNSSGVAQWATAPTCQSSASDCYPYAVATDVTGNIYLTGYFNDTVSFGTYKLTTPYSTYMMFIAKYDAAGKVLWAKQAVAQAFGYSVATDKSGNAYVTGTFYDSLVLGSSHLYTQGSDVFLAKYDPKGNVLWARQGNSYGTAVGNAVIADGYNNTYITGYFSDTMHFGSTTLKTLYSLSNHYVDYGDAFLAKYDSNGNILWAKQSDVPSATSFGVSNSVTVDKAGNAYLTGYFSDTMAFGSFTLAAPDSNLFIVKYNASGSVAWAKRSYGGCNWYSYWRGNTIRADAHNHIYLTGTRGDDSIWLSGLKLNTVPGYATAFIMEFDTSGNGLCGSILSNGGGTATGLACDSTGGYVYTAGVGGQDTMFFGPDTLVIHVASFAPYLARWQTCTSNLENINEVQANTQNAITLYPNPNHGIFNLTIRDYQLGMKTEVEVYNMLGEKVYSQLFLIPNSQFLINMGTQPAGIYMYRVVSESGVQVGEGKFIIEK